MFLIGPKVSITTGIKERLPVDRGVAPPPPQSAGLVLGSRLLMFTIQLMSLSLDQGPQITPGALLFHGTEQHVLYVCLARSVRRIID